MRRSHHRYETVLIYISLFAVIVAFLAQFNVINYMLGFFSLIWLLLLGILQVTHALTISSDYWNNLKIRKSIKWYWIGVGLDFVAIYLQQNILETKLLSLIAFVILPAILALYLWYICFRFRLPLEENQPDLM